MISRRFAIHGLSLVPFASSPDEVGFVGDVELSVDGEPVDPINVVRCEHGMLHLVYSITPKKPAWAYNPDVEDQIVEFVEEALENWRRELSP